VVLSVTFTVTAIQYCLFTLALERRVVWRAPHSFAKYAHLVGRYLPILVCALEFMPLGGFWGIEGTDAVRESRANPDRT
jgi:hypothetical protein